ncbi:hypothetical protein DM02DRAFT_677174 [Periconia macrospinosa]|uniref:Serine hydrolase domain-containing protein n=1 Tax=Periconia macrospinosa TaxID=97972 RepID=A0A2V1D4K8_9PLEO|nr:hypothetical protein DM02DRAFT_677174 [Periconia macrospinosa]
MRFLCLHGGGTNNRIFELQLASIRYDLGPGNSFEFVEGCLAHGMFPGIDSLVAPSDGFFAYFDPHSAKSIINAVDDLQKYVETEGPFDAVLAFSQGCGLAATWLATAHGKNYAIKAAVFFSGEPAFSPKALEQGVIKNLDPLVDGSIILPALHIWGARDDTNPERNKMLYEQWDDRARALLVHPGAHELPGSAMDALVVTDIVHRIRRLCSSET